MLTNILDFVGLEWDEVVMEHEKHMDNVGLSGAERSTDQVRPIPSVILKISRRK